MRGKTTIVCHLAHRREKAQIKDLRGNQIETHQDQRDHHTDLAQESQYSVSANKRTENKLMMVVSSAKINTKIQAGILGNHNCKKLAAATASAMMLIIHIDQ